MFALCPICDAKLDRVAIQYGGYECLNKLDRVAIQYGGYECLNKLDRVAIQYGGYECLNNHYYEECGNYHTTIYINGEEVVNYEPGCDTKDYIKQQDEIFERVVMIARNEWNN
jgi:hypothetical protein